MSDLSQILAGPVLRRVTASQLYIWVASREKIDYQLQILDQQYADITPSNSKLVINQQQLGTTKSSLWVTLLELQLEEGVSFPCDVLLYYTIIGLDLSDVSLEGCQYPSFYIPSKLSAIVHGSCRKPHGEAKYDDYDKETKRNDLPPPPDALAVLAQHLNQYQGDLSQRPSHLLLAGDQIYADDVSSDLIPVLSQMALLLMGEELALPGISKPSEMGLGERLDKLKELECGLTSTSAQNHLLTFGEYAAMYLFVYGNASNWQITTQDKYLTSFVSTLPDVRKVFANISTHMIFDDHDVTDDWNITSNWYDTVRYSPTGRRVVSNAIAAYYVFQHIGNSEDSLDDSLNHAIQLHLADTTDEVRNEYYDLYLWKHRGWAYSIPTDPPIIVLDTRTQRDFTGSYRAASLMDHYAADWLRLEWAKLRTEKKGSTPIIVSSTPVIGFNPVEKAQSAFVKLLSLFMPFIRLFRGTKMLNSFTRLASVVDFESWIANKKGFSYFLDTLLLRMKIKKVVFLSGDVHYSFVNKATYTSGKESLECYQLTSSAIHNSPKGSDILNGLAVISDQKSDTEVRRGLRPLRFPLDSSLIWKLEVKGQMSNSEYDRFLTRRPNVGLVYFKEGEVVMHKLHSGTGKKHCMVFEIK